MSDALNRENESFFRRTATQARANPAALGIAAVFLLLLLAGIVPRVLARIELARDARLAEGALPRVAVTPPKAAPSSQLSLPGSAQPFQQAVLYARVSGYLDKRLVDIGDVVKAGALLAQISAPELDQQLAQAKADQGKAEADLEFARSSLRRFEEADKDGAIAKEDLDQRRNAVRTAEATVKAEKATVAGLAEQQGFERVVAPFDGIVTERHVDTGALITAGGGSNTPLFALAQTSTLRVYVNVPQAFVDDLVVGKPVKIHTRTLPGREFTGTVARTAGSLDIATRTMLTEVDIPNAEGALKAGMYLQVDFQADLVGPRWRVPASAVIFDGAGTQLAIVDADNTLRLRKVLLGRDFGDEIEISSGINGDEKIVTTPSAALTDGTKVEPVQPKAPDQPIPHGIPPRI
ncbi:MAG TPA: efflux RND transporter periplasmic adaptor subunit [Myxococcota bacterium]|nr:efflux RND transporter periplasmic adaptor subunit [Myxococcota bacterium]